MGRKGNLAVFESSNISETRELYLHEYFDPILFFTIYSPWSDTTIIIYYFYNRGSC